MAASQIYVRIESEFFSLYLEKVTHTKKKARAQN